MTAPTEIRERAIALLDQLPGESLERAVEFLEALSHESLQVSKAPKPELDEEALLQVIQKRLSPEERDRIAYLRQRNEDEEITDAEHEELLLYVDRVEQQDAERVGALIQLAKLRSCDVKILIDEFLPKHSHIT